MIPIIHRHNTAISSKSLSAPTTIYLKKGYIKNVILDWGCGRGRDTNWLNNRNYQVISYDPYYCPLIISEIPFYKIKSILLNYVLNVIEHKQERADLLNLIKKMATPGTLVMIATRTQKEIKTRAVGGKWTEFNDGYITGRQTFQKGYTLKELLIETNFLGNILESFENHTFVYVVIEIN